MLSKFSRTRIASAASAAVACAVLSSSAIDPAQAARTAPNSAAKPTGSEIAKITTTRGEVVRFTLLSDGSVGVDAATPPTVGQRSALARQNFETPVDLFHSIAPSQPVPLALQQANQRYDLRRAADGGKLTPNNKSEHSGQQGGKISPFVDSWFINSYCNPHSSYNVCYAWPAWSWAYLSSSSVYYGHSVVYANSAPLLFSVSPVGQWQVPQYWTWSAWHYHSCWPFNCNFAFNASVNYAQYFDFEADVDY